MADSPDLRMVALPIFFASPAGVNMADVLGTRPGAAHTRPAVAPGAEPGRRRVRNAPRRDVDLGSTGDEAKEGINVERGGIRGRVQPGEELRGSCRGETAGSGRCQAVGQCSEDRTRRAFGGRSFDESPALHDRDEFVVVHQPITSRPASPSSSARTTTTGHGALLTTPARRAAEDDVAQTQASLRTDDHGLRATFLHHAQPRLRDGQLVGPRREARRRGRPSPPAALPARPVGPRRTRRRSISIARGRREARWHRRKVDEVGTTPGSYTVTINASCEANSAATFSWNAAPGVTRRNR